MAVGLVVASVIYVVFALLAGEWLGVELAGVLLFVLIAYAAAKTSPWLLAIGWGLHVVWDGVLHLVIEQSVVSAWYPLACITFDAVMVVYILVAARTLRPA